MAPVVLLRQAERAIAPPKERGDLASPIATIPAPATVGVIGFGQGVPQALSDALHAWRPAVRVEPGGGLSVDTIFHLVEVPRAAACNDAAPPRGLAEIVDAIGPRLAICPEGVRGLTLPAIAAGACGVLYLHDDHDDLVRALQAAGAGAPAFTASAARELLAHARGDAVAQPEPPPSTIRLTARERQVIALADQGLTFTQAARVMGVEVSTVYTHVRRIYGKLSVNSLPQALCAARRERLL